MSLCSDYLTDIDDAYALAKNVWVEGDTYRAWLYANYSTSSFTLSWRTNVTFAIGCLYSIVKSLIWGNTDYPVSFPLRIPYYLTNCVGGVDMDAILTAMLGSNFDQLQQFIGIEDAYRVALWNAPFNANYYNELVRKFQTWP